VERQRDCSVQRIARPQLRNGIVAQACATRLSTACRR
uniref:Lysozyme n=1 Tax=Globodera pallida TaxID=36090 RepID=A0A183C9L0_GLOPA